MSLGLECAVDILVGCESGAPINACEVIDEVKDVEGVGVSNEATLGANRDWATVDAGMSVAGQGGNTAETCLSLGQNIS